MSSHMQMFILWHNLFCEDSSIFRSFESSFHQNFVSLGDFSIDHVNFLRKCFELSKRDREISFEISLKIRENKGRISFSHYFCTVLYLTVNSTADYECLCTLDVLGLADTPTGDQGNVYKEFKEQFTRSPEGWYKIALPWKGNPPPLPNNYEGSIHRLNTLVCKLRHSDMLSEYDAVISEQLEQGVVEKVPEKAKGKEFYLPHRTVMREEAETTKLRVVYDASARAHGSVPSLNECLHAGPPLRNKLWSVLIRSRLHAVAVAGDLRKAFLQVQLRETERDTPRFHWIFDKHSKAVETL